MDMKIDPKTMFRQEISLNDGSKFDGSAYTSSDLDTLYVRLGEQYSMIDMFPVFTDPEKVSVIRSTMYSENSHTYISDKTFQGYIRMVSIGMDGSQVSVSLKKPLSE